MRQPPISAMVQAMDGGVLCFDREVDLLPSRNKAERGHATLFSGGDPCSMIAVVFKNLPCNPCKLGRPKDTPP